MVRRVSRLIACAASVLTGVAVARWMEDPHPPTAHASWELVSEPGPQAPAAAGAREPVSAPDSRSYEEALGRRLGRGGIVTGRTPHRLLLFTFDDGPDLRTTPRLLDILDELGVRAVFFLSSGRISGESERGRRRAALAREIADRGHMLGDHTVDHALLTRLPNPSIVAQLEASQRIFVETFGERPWLFRPPGGSRSERVDALIAAQGYTQVLWNLGAADHEVRTKEDVLAMWRRYIGGREQTPGAGGGVILLHDTHEWTVDAVPLIVEDIRRRNCALLARDEELWDVVPDPSFFVPAGDAPPGAQGPPAPPDPGVVAERQARLRREAAAYCGGGAAEPVIEDPSGRALDAFYAALARVDAARATPGGPPVLARVTHMGDSGVDRDQLPHHLRRRFQARFGDGGSGFVLVQPASPEYRNQTVSLSVPADWATCSILTRCDADGHYGLGGVVASSERGSRTRIATRAASRVELWYGAQPGGGRLALRVDEAPARLVETQAPALEDRWLSLDVAEGAHHVTVEAMGGGPARVYGVVLETDGPGVVWDTVSTSGAFTVRMLEHDAEHFARQLHHRRSDLVILHYGGNDLRRYLSGALTPDRFRDETRRLLDRVRSARPAISCLLTGIADHGKSGPLHVRSEHVEPLVEAQRAAAREAGCAFFDTYRAMGGRGSARRWQREGLVADDLVHLSPEGRAKLAEWLYDALMEGYEERQPPMTRAAQRPASHQGSR